MPGVRRHEKNTSSVNTFHGRFSVLSALLSPTKLEVCNCSHRHHGESKVHSRLMIEIIIHQYCFIVFYCIFSLCGTPSWYIESKVYHQKTRSFFL